MPNQPTYYFSEQFDGIIWSTLVLPERKLLLIEVRDGENLNVRFSAYNFETRSFLWKNWMPLEHWWLSLLAVKDNLLLLNFFKGSGNPDHKTLIACDINRQAICWQVPEFSFHHWQNGEIAGYSTKDDVVQAIIDEVSGEMTIQPWPSHAIDQPSGSILPSQFVEGSAHFESIRKFIEQRTDKKAVKSVEYIDWEHFLIVSFYTQTSGGLANFLIVTDKDGLILLEDGLGENLSGLGQDSFFIVAGCLFYVKNRSELVAYKLYG